MQLIYQAQNSVEAHLLLNLFKQAGLKSRIDGEYLQGGMGELQVSGIVRVMIVQEDYQEAKEIVRQWESKEKIILKGGENKIVSEVSSSPFTYKVKWRYLFALLIFFLVYSVVISAVQVNTSCFPGGRSLVPTDINDTTIINLSEQIQNTLLVDLLKSKNAKNGTYDMSRFINEKKIVRELVEKGRIKTTLDHLELLIAEIKSRDIKVPEYLNNTLKLLRKESSLLLNKDD
jgi:hypothetical protein